MRGFVKKYQADYKAFLAYETYRYKPFVMPVSACVDAWMRAQIIKFEMCKQPEEVIEEDWINYSREALTTDSLELGKIDHIMRKFRTTNACWISYLAAWKLDLPRIGGGGSPTLCGAGRCEEDRKLDG